MLVFGEDLHFEHGFHCDKLVKLFSKYKSFEDFLCHSKVLFDKFCDDEFIDGDKPRIMGLYIYLLFDEATKMELNNYEGSNFLWSMAFLKAKMYIGISSTLQHFKEYIANAFNNCKCTNVCFFFNFFEIINFFALLFLFGLGSLRGVAKKFNQHIENGHGVLFFRFPRLFTVDACKFLESACIYTICTLVKHSDNTLNAAISSMGSLMDKWSEEEVLHLGFFIINFVGLRLTKFGLHLEMKNIHQFESDMHVVYSDRFVYFVCCFFFIY